MNPYNNFASPNILPPQQIIQVSGKSSVDSIQMSPNSSVLLMDNTAPIVWMCISDGIGRVTAIPYDVKIHEETPQPTQAELIEQRLTAIETAIKEMKHNDKSYAQKSTAKPNGTKPQSGQKHDEHS